ncbi:MAG: hypothetical protein V3U87_13275 [Methylococcaceae bacterium]
MESNKFESVFLKLLKRVMLFAMGSGLLTNALYIYGIAYYQGYIERLGFEYTFFPIDWDEALIWTYIASQELGVSTIDFWPVIFEKGVLVLLGAFYVLARVWMSLSNQNDSISSDPSHRVRSFKCAKKVIYLRKQFPRIYSVIYVPIKWLLITEQSLIAFVASYFFMLVLLFIPIFIFIWVFFPLVGLNHGQNTADKRLGEYEKFLCGSAEKYWSECITVPVLNSGNNKKNQETEGRLIVKNKDLIGILTKDAPVTTSMPKIYYHKTEKNPCYDNGCEKNVK